MDGVEELSIGAPMEERLLGGKGLFVRKRCQMQFCKDSN